MMADSGEIVVRRRRAAMTSAMILFLTVTCSRVDGQAKGLHNETGLVNEYCEADTFSARCSDPDEVIVIRLALFGRMRLGRCLTSGNFGCQLDVLPQLEARCSGRRRCDVPVSSVNHVALPCTREVRGYLEASYVCVRVVAKRKEECQRSPQIEVSAMTAAVAAPTDVVADDQSNVRGYLASVVTEETGCGSMDAPWLIRAHPGQTIRLELIDFGTAERGSKTESMPYVCQVYAVIKEKLSSRAGETICASENRETHVYTSITNLVEIRMVAARKDHKTEHFMLKYEVTGCADMVPSGDGSSFHWMRRIGETAMLGCNSSSVTWQLKCDGKRWTGKALSCSQIPPAEHRTDPSNSIWNAFSTSQWAAIIVIMVIAVTLGMIIFFVGLVYLKKRRSNRFPRVGGPIGGVACTGSQHCGGSIDYHLAMSGDGHQTATLGSPSKLASGNSAGTITPGAADQTENDYFRTWQLQRPATMTSAGPHGRGAVPLPPMSHPGHGSSGRPLPGSLRFAEVPVPRGGTVPEHVYESPKLDRRDFVTSPTSMTNVNNDCSCCCGERTNGGNVGGVNVCGMQDGDLCSCGQTHLQYYELDHTGRPARV